MPGTTVPPEAGNPTVSVDPNTGQQVLVWSNLTDIGPGGTFTLEFQATLGDDGDVVGQTLLNTAYVAAQTDPREVPGFDDSGIPVPGTYSESATASRTTKVTAVQIRKSSDNAPEGELLRGVHDQRSTYTLTVTNNEVDDTTGVTVVDYLPAALEFLGCGDTDNTQPPAAVEYPGAPRLGTPSLNPGPTCLTPSGVDTVTDPPPLDGVVYPPGIYTRVQWSLPDLTPNATVVLRYVAGIPLRANTDTWPNGRPTAASGLQGANLDNNTGASSRELANESGLTNQATVAGTYAGPIVGSDPTVTDTDDRTVAVEDVRMRKSVSPSQFSSDGGGDVATFTLTVDTSEYVTGSGIVITDVLPDGYCPLGGSQNYAPGSPAECDPGGGSAPSTGYGQVTFSPSTGAYTIVFDPLAMTEDDTATVTFQARMRNVYAGGSRAGFPTVAGDTFTNTVSLQGSTTPVPGTGESGAVTVGDTSSATQGTGAPTIDKEIKPRDTSNLFTGNPTVDCATGTAPAYGEPASFSPTQLTFRQGDQICFKLRVDFPTALHTRAPVVSDFFPVDTRYIVNSYAATAANTVTIASFTPPGSAPGAGAWVLGDDRGGVRFAGPGDVFEVVLAVTVLEPAAPPKPDLLGNLMKLRTQNTAGTVLSFRDSVDFDLAPGANLALTKGVYAVDAPPNGPNPAGQDGKVVQEDAVATFRIDLQNLGRDGYPGANFSARGVQAWDVLPVGIDCSRVSNFGVVTHGTVPPATVLSPAALPGQYVACTDAGDPGHPAVDPAYGTPAQSVIVWTFPSPDVAEAFSIFVGQTMTLTYDMQLPSSVGVSTRFDNTAAVQSFRSFTNVVNETSEYYPQDNIDPSVQSLENVQAADDPSWVVTPDASVSKAVTTQIGESNNNVPNQATIGELVTYTVGVTVPAHTTVYGGVLTDPMPTGLTFVSATAGFSATGSPPVGALPGGFTLDGANGTLTFPATYQNATSSPHLLQVTITARMSTLAGNTHGTVRTNTASFTSTAGPGGAALPARTAQASVTVVEPNPRLVKAANPREVIGGQTVTYALTATNANNRPPSHDTSVVDCLPPEVAFGTFTSVPAGTTTAVGISTGGDGCTAGQTRIVWTVGTVLAGTANRKVLTYTGIIDPNAVGGASYTNNATLTGGSLDNGSTTPDPFERIYTRTASATVHVTTLGITKGVLPEFATIGDTVTYTATARIPAATTFYEAALVDVLPAGLAATAPDFATVSVTCVLDGTTTPCTGLDPGFGTPLTSSGQTVGWYLGDLPADATNDRFITVTYDTVVLDDAANTAGATRDNAATARWNLVDGGGPITTVGQAQALTNGIGPAVASLGIIEPQLTVDKVVSDTTPGPGEPFDYVVTVTNGSGADVSEAFDIDVADDIPGGVVVDPGSISDGGILSGTTASGNGTITWTGLGPLAPGESIMLTYSATLAPSNLIDGTARTNRADITRYFSLPTGYPERRQYDGPTTTATVTPQFPRFTTDKTTPDGSTASIGEPFTWRIEVTNSGGAPGFDVDAVDTLPPNWTYDAGSAVLTIPQPGGTPVALEPVVSTVGAVQTLTWADVGDLAAGAVARIEFTATPTPDVVTSPGVGLSVPNTNSVVATGVDATDAPGNLAGSYSAGPGSADAFIPKADLAIDKSPAAASVSAGGTATWDLTVTNLGPDPSAQPFRVVDSLPPGLTLNSVSGTGWTCITQLDGTTVICARSAPATITTGQSLPPITVVADVPIGLPEGTQFTNTAEVFPTTYDPNPLNNTDSAEVTLEASADLAIAKTSAQPVVAGTDVVYTLLVSNLGPDPSEASPGSPIVVTDTLPLPLTFVSAVGTDWTCSNVGQDVTCNRTADLDDGTDAPPITVTASLPADYTGTLANTAVVTPQLTLDPVPANNTATVTDTVTTSADLAIDKSHTGTVDYLGTVSFTLAVTNLGPSVSRGVSVTDTLPAGLTPTAASGTGWTCTVTGQTVDCDLGPDLAVGPAAPITVTADVGADAVPSVVNSATVSATTPDPDLSNNTDDDPVAVAPVVDLTLVKSHTGDFLVGRQGTFTLTVGNNGPTRDPGPLTVTDTLPTGLAFVSGTANGWTCTAAGQEVTCTGTEPLEVGASDTIALVVDVLPAAYPQVTNPASVTSPATDTDPDNNRDTDTVTVGAEVDLSVAKTGSVTVGRTATWTIAVSNAGPSATVGPITVTDELPSGLAFDSASGTGWACGAAGNVVTCTYAPSLAAGATATVTLVTSITGADGVTITNVATATTPGAVESAATGQGSVTPQGGAGAGLAFTGRNALQLLAIGLGLVLTGWAAAWAAPRGGLTPGRRRRRTA